MSKSSIERRFLGVVKYDPNLSKEENKFNQKHLKNYLAGNKEFTFGKEIKKDKFGREYQIPKVHKVQQEINPVGI